MLADLAQGIDQSNRLALGPIGQINDPFCGQHRGHLSDDPTMGRVYLAVTVGFFRWGLVNEFRLDGVQQRRLIAFDRQQVVTALVRDLTGDVLLAPHGIDGNEQPVDIQCLQEFRDRGNLIALAGDFFLAENDAQFRREGADHVNGALAATARPAYRLAIDPQAAFQGTDHPSHPTAERRLKLLRVEGSEDPQKRFLGGHAVLAAPGTDATNLPSHVPNGRCLRWCHNRRARLR
jgi:hypothetical protein